MEFSIPWHALIGGSLLGLSAGVLMLFSGKVAGISGIIGGLFTPKEGDWAWRFMFVLGMIGSIAFTAPIGFDLPDLSSMNIVVVAIAGLLVGIGTRLGNGCTSGHGIVGMGRLSKRSIVATCTFMTVAIFVVFIRRSLGVL
ncbi:YeeE/YedE family protein [Vibrio splendidus]|uniref:YeeE/YedE family protein n=1 Tax=Vibrio splendidus TaxID=29497 RepID=UPI003D0D39A6